MSETSVRSRIVLPGVLVGLAVAALRLVALALWIPVARTDLVVPVVLAIVAGATVWRAGFAGSAGATVLTAVVAELVFIEGSALLGIAPWRGSMYLGAHLIVVTFTAVVVWGLVAIVVAAASRYRRVGYAFGAFFFVGAIGALIGSWSEINLRYRPYGDRLYDAATWQADGGRTVPGSRRGLMVGDLRARVIRKGMTRGAVLEAMGEPDYRNPDGSMGYSIGLWSGLKKDYDSMDVEFDAADKVVRTVQHQH